MIVRRPCFFYGASFLRLLPVLASLAAAQATQISFFAPRDFIAGENPVSTAVADLNHDGKIDVVQINRGTNGGYLAVLLGDGAGAFSRPSFMQLGGSPGALATGDFNHDSNPDVLITQPGGNDLTDPGYVMLLRGRGDGTFAPPIALPGGPSPDELVVADLNADGNLDYVTLSGKQPMVYSQLGNGDGTFHSPQTLTLSLPGLLMDSADFNEDGFPDLAVSESQIFGYDLAILLGNGDGSFRLLSETDSSGAILFTSDFNADGAADLAIAYTDHIGFPYTDILLGHGDGSFTEFEGFVTVLGKTAVDLNGDGFPDLLAQSTSSTGANGIYTLLGRGNGTFGTPKPYGAYRSIGQILAADFNRDGNADVLVPSGPSVAVFSGRGDGRLVALPFGSSIISTDVILLDVNGDTRLDLVRSWSPSEGPGWVSVAFGNGDATFQTEQRYDIRAKARGAAVGDLNGDGFLDIAVASTSDSIQEPEPGQIEILIGAANGAFALSPISIPGRFGTSAVAIGDLNGDSVPDIAFTNSGIVGFDRVAKSFVGVAFGTGSGGFAAPVFYETWPALSTILLADLDGDAHPEIITAGPGVADYSAGATLVYWNDGAGSFSVPTTLVSGATPSGIAAEDLNHDGRLDLAIACSGNLLGQTKGVVAVFLNAGSSAFQEPTYHYAGASPEGVKTADFTGDGIPDLAVVADFSQDFSILSGNGDGTFQNEVSFGTAYSAKRLALGDLNADGKLDVVTNDGSIVVNTSRLP